MRDFDRMESIATRITAEFERIDPRHREIDEGETLPRVCYTWGVQYGEVWCDISGSGVSNETRSRYVAAIIDAIRAEA